MPQAGPTYSVPSWYLQERLRTFILQILLVISILAPAYTAPRNPRLTLLDHEPAHYYHEYDKNPNAYSFGYDVADPATGNNQYRAEQRHANGTVTGSYGYIDPYGKPVRYKYIADSLGYSTSLKLSQNSSPTPTGFDMSGA
ncbi:hypothetical protein SFRURICE_007320 [Spodoptera frugiperda]|nr:hypothetical protein SFRURICE_007320 [Spodoptera frugiperda]